jgi:hypothetical protein
MADEVKVKIHRSLTSTSIPANASLQEGELAANIADAKLWVGDASGNPVLLGGGAVSNVTSTLPTSAQEGELWWHTDLGKLFIYYNDGGSSQWVETGPGAI